MDDKLFPKTEERNSRNPEDWERKVIEKLVFSTLEEQKTKRRWSIFFRVMLLLCFLLLIGQISSQTSEHGDKKHIAVISLSGVIAEDKDASANRVVRALNNAFEKDSAAGVILRINSPGGSPVQSAIINDEIHRLRAKHPDKPIHAVVEDLCASGGYFVAVATEKIYVNKASIVGSIGVLMDGFGFTGTMEKLGVERRLLTAGGNKGFLDPFSPQVEAQQAHAKALLADVHQQFIDVVRKGRGNRLHETPDMFSGLMWTGAQSVKLGLADEFGDVRQVAREVFGVPELRDYTLKEEFLENLGKRLGVEAGQGIWQGMNEKLTAPALR